MAKRREGANSAQVSFLFPSDKVNEYIQAADELEEEFSGLVVEGEAEETGARMFKVKADNGSVLHEQSANEPLRLEGVKERLRELLGPPSGTKQ